jgi:hypothetical protein
MTMVSGRHTTDAGMAVNLNVAVSVRPQADGSVTFEPTGSFTLESKGQTRIPVTIDGRDHLLEAIHGDITGGVVSFDGDGFFRLTGTADVIVAGLQFSGRVVVHCVDIRESPDVEECIGPREPPPSGGPCQDIQEGSDGSSFGVCVAIGPEGERGTVKGSGIWKSGPGFRFAPESIGPAQTYLLKGRYSGGLHGCVGDHPYGAVLVLTFDGNGGITNGKKAEDYNGQFDESFILPTYSSYSLDSDGYGHLHIHGTGMAWSYRIAAADNGKVVKIVGFAGSAPFSLPAGMHIVGELVKQ